MSIAPITREHINSMDYYCDDMDIRWTAESSSEEVLACELRDTAISAYNEAAASARFVNQQSDKNSGRVVDEGKLPEHCIIVQKLKDPFDNNVVIAVHRLFFKIAGLNTRWVLRLTWRNNDFDDGFIIGED